VIFGDILCCEERRYPCSSTWSIIVANLRDGQSLQYWSTIVVQKLEGIVPGLCQIRLHNAPSATTGISRSSPTRISPEYNSGTPSVIYPPHELKNSRNLDKLPKKLQLQIAEAPKTLSRSRRSRRAPAPDFKVRDKVSSRPLTSVHATLQEVIRKEPRSFQNIAQVGCDRHSPTSRPTPSSTSIFHVSQLELQLRNTIPTGFNTPHLQSK